MAIKLEGGGKTLMDWTLIQELFLRFSLPGSRPSPWRPRQTSAGGPPAPSAVPPPPCSTRYGSRGDSILSGLILSINSDIGTNRMCTTILHLFRSTPDRDRYGDGQFKREIENTFYSETWPRLEPGPFSYMHNRSP